jgi:hypothetical protein
LFLGNSLFANVVDGSWRPIGCLGRDFFFLLPLAGETPIGNREVTRSPTALCLSGPLAGK